MTEREREKIGVRGEEEKKEAGREREGGVGAHSSEKSRIWVRLGTQMISLWLSIALLLPQF